MLSHIAFLVIQMFGNKGILGGLVKGKFRNFPPFHVAH